MSSFAPSIPHAARHPTVSHLPRRFTPHVSLVRPWEGSGDSKASDLFLAPVVQPHVPVSPPSFGSTSCRIQRIGAQQGPKAALTVLSACVRLYRELEKDGRPNSRWISMKAYELVRNSATLMNTGSLDCFVTRDSLHPATSSTNARASIGMWKTRRTPCVDTDV
jgi:hypothetical protein